MTCHVQKESENERLGSSEATKKEVKIHKKLKCVLSRNEDAEEMCLPPSCISFQMCPVVLNMSRALNLHPSGCFHCSFCC